MWSKTTIVGYLGADPEMRYLDTGVAVCNFSIATSRKYNRKDGTSVDETTWFRVTVWGNPAENAYKYLTKGCPVLVEGQLKPDKDGNPRTFQRNDGTWGSKYEITASDVRYLPGGNGQQQQSVVGGSDYQEYKKDENPPWMGDGQQQEDDEDEEFVY